MTIRSARGTPKPQSATPFSTQTAVPRWLTFTAVSNAVVLVIACGGGGSGSVPSATASAETDGTRSTALAVNASTTDVAATTGLAAKVLRANAVNEPLAVDTATPTLSWQLTATLAGAAQSAYQVRVLDATGATAWDSGKVTSADQSIVYAGRALRSRERLSWQVQVWDASGAGSGWSTAAHFGIGLLQASDWSGTWIAGTDTSRLPLLSRDFSLTKPIASARLYAAGLGAFEARLNGSKVGDAVLEPANTDYRKRIRYATYDVTALLRSGANTIGFWLGNGIYNVPSTPNRYQKFSGSQGLPKLLAQLEVTYNDGTSAVIATDASGTWKTIASPITFSGWYGGEDFNASAEPTGWDAPGADRSAWQAAASVSAPTGVLHAQEAPPVRVQEQLTAVSRTQVASGVWLYDLGRNIAGWPQVTLRNADAQTVVLTPGERLTNGRVDQSNTGNPMYYTYIPHGNSAQTWHPRFTYTGFRYIEISGVSVPPEIADVQAQVLRGDNPRLGSLVTSDASLNKVHDLVMRATESNMMSILTDCPHREKLGWLEETHLLYDTLAANFDVQAATRQWTANLIDSQQPDGMVPSISPEYVVFGGAFRDDVNWGGAMVMMPYKAYRNYGDVAPLRENYAAMGQYMGYLAGRKNGDGVLDYGLADWGSIDNSTPAAVTATTAWYRYAMAMQEIATAVGDASGATNYATQAGQIKTAFNAKYFDAVNGRYGSSQASNAMPLAAGIVPDATPTAWSTVASEGQNFSVVGPQLVRYGAGNSWVTKVVTGNGSCSNAFFGNDPVYGTVKQCQAGWLKLVGEGSSFSVSGSQEVRYGSGNSWVSKVVTGSAQCSNAFFGNDPLVNVVKQCETGMSDNRSRVLAALKSDVLARGTHLSTGEIGLRGMLDAFGDAGEAQLVLDMALNPTQPSYQYMVSSGATTLWEYWDGSSSQNHFMMGAIDDWSYRMLAGLKPTTPGFRSFSVTPQVPDRLDSIDAKWPTAYGLVGSRWVRDRNAKTYTLDVVVPVGTTATVAVPLLGARGATAPAGAVSNGTANGRANYTVGSGTWTFTVALP